MTKKLFCVPILNSMVHSDETIKILEPHRIQRRQSRFIREAILAFAITYGYKSVSLGEDRPISLGEIISSKLWQRVQNAHIKGYLNYNFVIAFYWLLSLPEFEKYNKSQLMREIITLRQ